MYSYRGDPVVRLCVAATMMLTALSVMMIVALYRTYGAVDPAFLFFSGWSLFPLFIKDAW